MAGSKPRGAVAAAHPLAVEAATGVLRKGGDAVDAALAAAFTLGVAEPYYSGLGGGGFLLTHRAGGGSGGTGSQDLLDYHSRCPQGARPEMFRGKPEGEKDWGYRAAHVPGTARGLAEARERYGRLPLAELLSPAIAHAHGGVEVTPFFHARASEPRFGELCRSCPAFAAIYSDGGEPWPVGHRLVQAELGASLERVAREGPGALYGGELSEPAEREFRSPGGLITREDLSRYEPRWVPPLRSTYRRWTIVTNRLPGCGPHLLQVLNLLEAHDLAALAPGSPEFISLLVAAFEVTFRERFASWGDPECVRLDEEELVGKARASALAREMVPRRARRGRGRHSPARAEGSTTHLSVVDGRGNAVSLTQTLGSPFGSGVVVAGLGFCWNNHMLWMEADPASPNAPGPG
ncbi:MAG: gamma-glutamyltransferase, partial [Nitrospinota bacterium]